MLQPIRIAGPLFESGFGGGRVEVTSTVCGDWSWAEEKKEVPLSLRLQFVARGRNKKDG